MTCIEYRRSSNLHRCAVYHQNPYFLSVLSTLRTLQQMRTIKYGPFGKMCFSDVSKKRQVFNKKLLQ